MTNRRAAYTGCDIFDGTARRFSCALLVDGSRIAGIVAEAEIPVGYDLVHLDGGLITAGFVDLQVNGGGGVMFNDAPSIESIQTICDAHMPFGTTSLLPTLITDTPTKTTEAITAAKAAIAAGVSGAVGLHLEGPHLSLARKGAHDPILIRTMEDEDCQQVVSVANDLQTLFLTVAPESVSTAQIATLTAAGAIVSIGHTDANFTQARAAADSGATCVTHLFNAMSPLTSREPGVVGAALETGTLSAGLIADGFHADPTSIAIALRAKRGPGKIFLVTDAMSTIGTDQTEFTLNGRVIKREGGRLTLPDGTLAGADLDMISAVRFMTEILGINIEETLRMASLYPAQVIKREAEIGQLIGGARADFILLDEALNIRSVWRAGSKAHDETPSGTIS